MLFPDPMPPQTPNTRTDDDSPLLPPDMLVTAKDNLDDTIGVLPEKKRGREECQDDEGVVVVVVVVVVVRLQAVAAVRYQTKKPQSDACSIMEMLVMKMNVDDDREYRYTGNSAFDVVFACYPM